MRSVIVASQLYQLHFCRLLRVLRFPENVSSVKICFVPLDPVSFNYLNVTVAVKAKTEALKAQGSDANRDVPWFFFFFLKKTKLFEGVPSTAWSLFYICGVKMYAVSGQINWELAVFTHWTPSFSRSLGLGRVIQFLTTVILSSLCSCSVVLREKKNVSGKWLELRNVRERTTPYSVARC